MVKEVAQALVSALFDGEMQGGVACFGLGFVVREKGGGCGVVVLVLVLILITAVSVHMLKQGTKHLMVIIQDERPNGRSQLPCLQFSAMA